MFTQNIQTHTDNNAQQMWELLMNQGRSRLSVICLSYIIRGKKVVVRTGTGTVWLDACNVFKFYTLITDSILLTAVFEIEEL